MPSTSTDRLSGLSTSVAVKAPCKVASISNITLSGEQTVSSVAVVADDRVLVTAQTSSVDNGIWIVSDGAWARAKDFDGARDVVDGTLVLVGTTAADSQFWLSYGDTDPIVPGTSQITFTQVDYQEIALRTDLANTADTLKGDALIGVYPTATGSQTTTLHNWINGQEVNVVSNCGIVADGTDQTAALLSLWTTLGANFVGLLYIPHGVKFNTNTVYAAAPKRAVIRDDSAVNSWDTSGSRARLIGYAEAGDSTSIVDLTWRMSSGHNAGICLDNTGSSGSTSGQKGIASIYWSRGQLSKQAANEGIRPLSRVEWAKIDGVDQWGYFLRKNVPWVANAWEYWYAAKPWTTGDHCINGGNVYRATTTGTSGATAPTHITGTVSDGGVSWLRIAYIDQTILLVNENGELALNTAPVAAVVAYLKASADSDGTAIVIVEATGASKRAELRLTPTDGAGALVQVPRLRGESGVGLRLVDSTVSKTLFSADDTNGFKLGQNGRTESVLTASGATPSVANAGMLVLANAGATSITGFTGGADNQEIELFFENGNTTLTHNASTFVLKGGVNVNPAANSIIVMRKYSRSSAWFEKSRNF